MSEVLEADDSEPRCASCGITGGDGINLMLCTACKLVRYCGIKCQKEHRPQHKRACKERAAELHDEILFRQPESSHLGDCPICCLPHSPDRMESVFMGCCGNSICCGCYHADKRRKVKGTLNQVCPFCRHPTPTTTEEERKMIMKRVEANDPHSLFEIGDDRYRTGDIAAGIKFWRKSAELGFGAAHFRLAMCYHNGEGVNKDVKKKMYHLEQASIAGHPEARYNLGCLEMGFGRTERGVKHIIISSNLGFDKSMKLVRELYAGGKVSKEEFATALRTHQAAVDATKSAPRSKVGAFIRQYLGNSGQIV